MTNLFWATGGFLSMVLGTSQPGEKPQEQGVEVAEREIRRPRMYQVILHNDDYTTMDFVVEVLTVFFGKTMEVAMQLMLEVHDRGRAVVGVYTFEIAETKVAQVHDCARERGFPLKCSMEPIL